MSQSSTLGITLQRLPHYLSETWFEKKKDPDNAACTTPGKYSNVVQTYIVTSQK